MSTQGIRHVELPEEVKKAVQHAETRVAVLKDTESELTKSNAELEKDVVRKEMRLEELELSIKELEAKESDLKGRVENATSNLETIRGEHNEIATAIAVMNETLAAGKAEYKAEAEKLSETTLKLRELETQIESEKALQKSATEAFEARKKALIEAIAGV